MARRRCYYAQSACLVVHLDLRSMRSGYFDVWSMGHLHGSVALMCVGWNRAGAAGRAGCEARALEHLNLVRNAPAGGVQRGLVGHRDAQRCLRVPKWWARRVGPHLRRGTHFAQSGRGRRVKTRRAFDARAPTNCQPSAVWSIARMPGSTRSRRGARARAHLEAPSAALSAPAVHAESGGFWEHPISLSHTGPLSPL